MLLPIVENAISNSAIRPGDVIRARNGKTTEITNTDAEGRLILADALSASVESPYQPKLIVDFATLTGAARVALGNDLPALFSNNQDEMIKLWKISQDIDDPMWMMPLYEPMRSNLKSSIADFVNADLGGSGGAITAALYLSEYITRPQVPSSKDEQVSDRNKNDSVNVVKYDNSETGKVVGAANMSAVITSIDNASSTVVGDTGNSVTTIPISIESNNLDSDISNSDTKASVKTEKPVWFHVDFMGSKGGAAEPQGMRSVFEYLKRYIISDQ